MKQTHVMFDIEALGYRPDAVVLTLGAVKFNPYSDDEPPHALYLKFDADHQILNGRTTDNSTLAWWATQNESVREEAMGEGGRQSVDDCLAQFHKFVWQIDNIWCQGPHYDVTIMENLCKMSNKMLPWQHWQIRDCRTLFKLGIDPEINKSELAHNALADAYFQAVGVQTVFRKLGLTEK